MASNPIEGLMSVAMENLKQMVDVNTIVGDAVQSNDGMTIIPVSKVSFGFGVGGSEFEAGKEPDKVMFGGGAGGGVSINPIAFLVVGKEQIKLMPVCGSSTTVDKIIDAVPDLFNKFNGLISDLCEKKKQCKKNEKSNDADQMCDDADGVESVKIVLED